MFLAHHGNCLPARWRKTELLDFTVVVEAVQRKTFGTPRLTRHIADEPVPVLDRCGHEHSKLAHSGTRCLLGTTPQHVASHPSSCSNSTKSRRSRTTRTSIAWSTAAGSRG